MAQGQQGNKGGGNQNSAVTRKKNRRSFLLTILYIALFIIYVFDKFYGDTGIVMWFRYLDEDGDSWFNPDMVEAGLQVTLVGGFAALCYMGIHTARNEEA